MTTTQRPQTADTQTEIRFRVTYAGPAVDSGEMDAKELGESLAALSDLISASASLTLGPSIPVQTAVASEFQRGSFSFLVVTGIHPDHVEHIARTLLQQFTLHDLFDLIGVTGKSGGLIALVKFLRGKKPRAITPAPNGQSLVQAGDGSTITVNAGTIVLYQNSTVRKHLEEVVAPVERQEGITEFRAGREGEPPTTVTKADTPAFEPPEPQGDVLQKKTSTEIVQVVSVIFQPGRKWKFRIADGTTFSGVIDPEFAKKVATHEVVFGSGDALEVELQTEVFRDATGELHAKRDLLRVVRHISAPKSQLTLDLERSEGIPAEELKRLPPATGEKDS